MEKKRSFNRTLVFITAVPIILLGMIISVSSYFRVQQEIYEEVEVELTNLVQVVSNAYDNIYSGDFELVEEGEEIELYKGDLCISRNFQYIDRFKETTGLDISIFYGDTRYSTTITQNNGDRAIRTKARSFVKKSVVDEGEIKFYKKVHIDGQSYFAVYAPMKDINGDIVGMMSIAKPTDRINEAVRNTILPIIVIVVVVLIISMLIVLLYFKHVGNIVKEIKEFLLGVSTGKLTAHLAPSIKNRTDEFGEIGRAAVDMQSSLKKLLEQDVLTELYNRGYGEKKLKEVIEVASKQEKPFTVALGDIDFFKKVNDTYGHGSGDMVLKTVSKILRENMAGNGYAIRWGGEEFLLVFKGKEMQESLEILEQITSQVSGARTQSGENFIQVNMTFGITKGEYFENSDDIVKRADSLLYRGKENGKDKICY